MKVVMFFVLIVSSMARSIRNSSGKIVGGSVVQPGQYPWVISIWVKNSISPFCGGSLLNDRWVLSAAHCFFHKTPDDVYVILGDYDTKVTDKDHEFRSNICKIKIHPKYHPKTHGYDIALIKLCTPVDKYTSWIKPIRLPVPGLIISPGSILRVAGWGTTSSGGQSSRLQKSVTIPTASREMCKRIFSFLSYGELCAGAGGRDSCQGDSGGPLWYTNLNNEAVQVGIVSSGIGCGNEGYPAIYTRVSFFFNWILEIMSTDSRSLQIRRKVLKKKYYLKG